MFLTVLSCLVWWGTALSGCQGVECSMDGSGGQHLVFAGPVYRSEKNW
jgi:hypothetical protein